MLDLTDRVVLCQAGWLTEVATLVIVFIMQALRAGRGDLVDGYFRDLMTVITMREYVVSLYHEELLLYAHERAVEDGHLVGRLA